MIHFGSLPRKPNSNTAGTRGPLLPPKCCAEFVTKFSKCCILTSVYLKNASCSNQAITKRPYAPTDAGRLDDEAITKHNENSLD